MSAVLDQPRPKVASSERSATAIAVESGNAKQSITFGWMVSKKLFGDTVPHIVISSVVNGVLQCINGCGFVPVVKNAPKISINHSGKYTIKLVKAKWLLVYNGKTLGYYPTSQFPGHKLQRAGVAVALGQVASPSKSKPKSDMGNGKLGTGARSAKVRDRRADEAGRHPDVPLPRGRRAGEVQHRLHRRGVPQRVQHELRRSRLLIT